MMTLDREIYLYAVGRMDLGKVELHLAVLLAPLFFVGAEVAPFVALSPTWLHSRGVGASETWAGRALGKLVHRAIIEPRKGSDRVPNLYQLRPVGSWDWPRGRLAMVREELRAMRGWGDVEWVVDALVELTTCIDPPLASAHPFDPSFVEWLDVCRELGERYGTGRTIGALREAARDPSALGYPTPKSFRASYYALLQRHLRREARHG